MRTNDIVDVFVAYIIKTGGKSRLVLIIKLNILFHIIATNIKLLVLIITFLLVKLDIITKLILTSLITIINIILIILIINKLKRIKLII